MQIKVSVPATSANLGAGFDVLGLALALHNEFTVTLGASTRIRIEGHCEGVPLDQSNLFYRSFAHLYALVGRALPPVEVSMRLSVPPGRGLGSSATAVVGGLMSANTYLGMPFSLIQLLAEAVKLEHGGHPDNVAPALLGGLVVSAVGQGQVLSVRVPFADDLRAVLFIPDLAMDTLRGRALMPEQYSRADVIFNTSRVALFLAAVTPKRHSDELKALLRVAMEDRLHQPYREQLFPIFPRLIEAALESGACGACLSGGGSSVLALATDHLEEIAGAMAATAEAAGVAGSAKVLDIDQQGARAEWEAAEQ